jgi:solute carrier family 44 protein 1 (choline transporter-like protein)
VKDTTSIFLVPFVFFFIIGFFVVFWVIAAVWMYSVGTPVKMNGLPVADIKWDNLTRYLWIYHLFGLFWVSAFIIGCAQFIIAATTCIWYFA